MKDLFIDEVQVNTNTTEWRALTFKDSQTKNTT